MFDEHMGREIRLPTHTDLLPRRHWAWPLIGLGTAIAGGTVVCGVYLVAGLGIFAALGSILDFALEHWCLELIVLAALAAIYSQVHDWRMVHK